jgi:hypothetical protein
MKCWHCEKQLDDFARNAIPFRATCDFCSADLHCCKNCRFYKPGQPNDCMIPGTEFVAYRDRSNHCEDFALATDVVKEDRPSKSDIEKRLFGD